MRGPSRRWLWVALVAASVGCSAWPGGPLDEARPRASIVYGRPLVLAEGLRLSGTALGAHLESAGYRRTRTTPGLGAWRRDGRHFEIARRAFRYPDGDDGGGRIFVSLRDDGRIGRLAGPDGESIAHAFLEPPVLGALGEEGGSPLVAVPLESFSEHVVAAVLAAEDRRFRWHPGLDPIRIVGAWLENRRAGRIVEGASTITQQLAKNLYLSPERTWSRKVREAGLAVWLEVRHSKDEILEAYLNQVYLGQDGGRPIHGFAQAARFYFGTEASDLGPAQAALLAGMIRAPNSLSPVRHPKRARARRDQVLDALLASGALTPSAHAQAVASELGVVVARRRGASAGHFLEWVRARRAERTPPARPGARIFTTLDGGFQRAAEAAVRGELARLEKRHPRIRRSESPLQAALVALDPQSGDVLAYVGSRDFAASPFDRAGRARRQPGSVFKPFVALAALGAPGRAFSFETVLADEPLTLEVEGERWRPSNHDRRHRGPVTLRRALEDSLNVPFVRLGLEVGLVHVAETARRLGAPTGLRPIPSLPLGAFEMTPLEVAAAYGVLAAGGLRSEPRAVLAELDSRGRTHTPMRRGPERVAPAADVHAVNAALQGAVRRGTARSLAGLGVRAPVAGKTGTTNGFRDAWFVGYSPDLVVAVWVGFDDGARVGLTGARAALPIFARFVRDAVGGDGLRDFPEPRRLAYSFSVR